MQKGVRSIRKISGRGLYTLILVGILLVAGVGFFTANLLSTTGVIPAGGHPINQTAPPNGCLEGQVLIWNGTSNINGGWDCISSSLNKGQEIFVTSNGMVTTSPSGTTHAGYVVGAS